MNYNQLTKELRIGNTIMHKHNKQRVTVKEISICEDGYMIRTNENKLKYDDRLFEGAKITTTILDNLGFEREDADVEGWPDVRWHWSRDNFWFYETVIGEYWVDGLSADNWDDLIYLHELENLYFILNRNELTPKN